MKLLNILKSALIFFLVWFVSIVVIGIIGSLFDVTNSESIASAIYTFAMLILPIALGFVTVLLLNKKNIIKAIMENAPYNSQLEPQKTPQKIIATTPKQSHSRFQAQAISHQMNVFKPFDGGLTPDAYQDMRNLEAKWLEDHYDFNSIDGIEKIPLQKNLRCPKTSGVTGEVYYYLRKKAYAHEDAGNIDLALACLKKSVALLKCNDLYIPEECYPLVKMLARNGFLEEAKSEKDSIDKHSQISEQQLNNKRSFETRRTTENFSTDLVIMDAHGSVCPECAKYQGRVYSISGKSSKFPKVPSFYFTTGCVHEGCSHSFWPYIDGVNNPDLSYTLSVHPLQNKHYGKNIVVFSNRPFVDDRTDECKAAANVCRKQQAEKQAQQQYYEDHMIEIEYQKYLDSCNVKWLQENFPTKAPKNVTGFRRMRTQNTKNYQALKQLAAEKGKDI